jgi:HAD superfamily hydrolase (TIGR01490 family)
VYKYTRGRIKWHLDQGHEVILISGSPKFLVEKMAKKYNVKHYSATEYLIDKNYNYTGELIPMWESDDKNREIDRYVAELDIDLSQSYAYGDTNGDYSMLKKVGNPIVINPIRKLVERIKDDQEMKDSIQIIIERKDVIYSLNGAVDVIESYESESN